VQSVHLSNGARFSCRSCGACCQGWAVPVDRATADRLRAHDWGGDPFEVSADPQQPFRIKLVEGRCFFLDAENRCRIHRQISYEAKPAVCRAFPLAVLEVGGKQYGRLSFWCPTVVDNAGKPLEHQLKWIKETARHVDRRSSPLRINDTIALAPREFDRVHQALRTLLSTTSLTIEDRLAAAAAVIGRLEASANGGGGIDRVLAGAEAEGAATLAAEARRKGRAAGGRRVLSLYLLQDAQGGRFSRMGRFFSLLLFGLGLAPVASKAVQAKASWRQVRQVSFEPPDASNELLTRYFCSKLDSRRYVAGEATLITGFNLMVAAYGVINLLARMRAAAAGRRSCSEEDIRAAVRAADLLVVEHRGQDRAGVQALLSQTALGSPGLCGDVLARLERNRPT
jgi:Fe-S-cluster containining protein